MRRNASLSGAMSSSEIDELPKRTRLLGGYVAAATRGRVPDSFLPVSFSVSRGKGNKLEWMRLLRRNASGGEEVSCGRRAIHHHYMYYWPINVSVEVGREIAGPKLHEGEDHCSPPGPIIGCGAASLAPSPVSGKRAPATQPLSHSSTLPKQSF